MVKYRCFAKIMQGDQEYMKDIKLSIIIPHYNSFAGLQKLIEGIPNHPGIQVIVVDDNSTEKVDGMEEYCRQRGAELFYNDSSVHSAGRCRNIGLEHAEGEWLLFADADDYFVQNVWDAASPYFEGIYDMVFFPPTSVDLRTGQESNRHVTLSKLAMDYYKNPTVENEVYLRYLWGGPYSKLIRASMLQKDRICFDETRVANDVMFSVKAACAADKITVDEHIIYCITKNDGTLVMSKDRKDIRTRVKVNVKKYCYLRKHAGKEAFRILDFRINYYLCIIRRNAGTKRDYIWTWLYCAIHGVRPFLSRKWTWGYAWKKLTGKAE